MVSLLDSLRLFDIANPDDDFATVCKRDLAEKRELRLVSSAVSENGHHLAFAKHVTAQTAFSQSRGRQRLERPLLDRSATVLDINVDPDVRVHPLDFRDHSLQRQRLTFVELRGERM